jgi:hypothetical protein
VKRLVLFHHDPARTDEEVDAIARSMAGGPVPVTVATEGLQIDVPATP